MVRRLITPDRVAIIGSVIGLVSLAFGWLTLKPNRLAAGTGLRPWEAIGGGGTAVILALWLVCLALILKGKGKRQAVILGTAANLILALTLVLAGSAAGRLLEGEPTIARVSLGAGVWISLVASYFVIHAVRQRLQGERFLQNLVSWTGLVALGFFAAGGWFNDLSVVQELMGRESRFLQELRQHLFLFGVSVAVGTLIGIPLGIWAVRSKRAARPILAVANITQTVPSLALFGLLIAPLSALSLAFPAVRELGIRGVGAAPALIALIIYSLLPIIRNTYVGLHQVNPAVIDSGLGMGMRRAQVFRKLELPLAAPLVLEGVRTAAVQAVGLTAVAALIGAGGLGWFIFQGLGQAAADLIILGAIPIIILALLVDVVMRAVVRQATPKGLVEVTVDSS
jgi:osmoprotectant transport system permease protein